MNRVRLFFVPALNYSRSTHLVMGHVIGITFCDSFFGGEMGNVCS